MAVAGGTLFGALYHGADSWSGPVTALGAGLLCAGCSALNQVQERRRDARMERTKNRPVASGAMPVRSGVVAALVLMVAGLGVFIAAAGLPLFVLGLAVPLIYNGLYTPLKPVTPMALLVGAFSGAMPPLVGWVGAGGHVTDPVILAVTTIFYLWQVPHFWLLHEKHRHDYERAGFATLARRLPPGLYTPLLALWVSAYFIGLGCLVFVAGAGAVSWVAAPVIVLGGAWALFGVTGNRRRMASVAVYGSLPLTLAVLLTTNY